MKKIPLKGKNGINKYIIVDDDDYEYLSKFSWFANVSPNTGATYARALVPVHRLVMGLPEDKKVFIDHKNRDTLDNRKENLRLCDTTRNQWNRGKAVIGNHTSIYKGVAYNAMHKGLKWNVRISKHGKRLNLGFYYNEFDAARMHDFSAYILHREFAYYNFPDLKPNDLGRYCSSQLNFYFSRLYSAMDKLHLNDEFIKS